MCFEKERHVTQSAPLGDIEFSHRTVALTDRSLNNLHYRGLQADLAKLDATFTATETSPLAAIGVNLTFCRLGWPAEYLEHPCGLPGVQA
jgi:hypothetical protein